MNRLKQFSPRPCNASAAYGFVEAWMDKGVLSTSAVFSSVWGMDHEQFLAKFFEEFEGDES